MKTKPDGWAGQGGSRAGQQQTRSRQDRSVGAVLLAAGHGRRFGRPDKRFALLDSGRSVLQACIDNISCAVQRFVVVLRCDDVQWVHALDLNGGRPVFIRGTGEGMGVSLAAGVRSMIDCDSVLILLADMPFIRPDTIRRVAAMSRDHPLVVPTFRSIWGHPVAFAKQFFPELIRLAGDEGGKGLLVRHMSRCRFVGVKDEGILIDIDTPTQLKHAAAQ